VNGEQGYIHTFTITPLYMEKLQQIRESNFSDFEFMRNGASL